MTNEKDKQTAAQILRHYQIECGPVNAIQKDILESSIEKALATVRAEVEAEYALCRQVQKRGEHSSVTCPCVVAIEQVMRTEEREAAFKEMIGMDASLPTQGTMNYRRGYEEGVRDALRTLEAATENRKGEG